MDASGVDRVGHRRFQRLDLLLDRDVGLVDQRVYLIDDYRLSIHPGVLQLVAEDAGGNASVEQILVEVTGDLKVGNFTLSFTDLSIPVSGIPIVLARTYDSLNAPTKDDLLC